MTIPYSVRKVLFWGHLSVGIAVGLWVVFMATTGDLIAFQAELLHFGEQRYQIATPAISGCVAPSVLRSTAQHKLAESRPRWFSLPIHINRPRSSLDEAKLGSWIRAVDQSSLLAYAVSAP